MSDDEDYEPEPLHPPYRDGKVHVMSERCTTCVFRPGNLMHLPPGRFKNMVDANVKDDTAFSCHQTLESYDQEQAVCHGYFAAYKDKITPLRMAVAFGVIREQDPPKKEGNGE